MVSGLQPPIIDIFRKQRYLTHKRASTSNMSVFIRRRHLPFTMAYRQPNRFAWAWVLGSLSLILSPFAIAARVLTKTSTWGDWWLGERLFRLLMAGCSAVMRQASRTYRIINQRMTATQAVAWACWSPPYNAFQAGLGKRTFGVVGTVAPSYANELKVAAFERGPWLVADNTTLRAMRTSLSLLDKEFLYRNYNH